MNGFEVARRIRQMEGGQAITLIAFSGYGSPEIRQKTVEAGFNAHFVKPMDFDQLLEAINKTTSSR
jgi:CheY-like chemotaxis protein